ncbi:MAG: hypothetical protein WAO58_01880 [Fimbriimonadaceae bacterium]
MNTYFARHTIEIDIDGDTRASLWDQRKVAIHFPDALVQWPEEDSTSLDLKDYVGCRGMRAMKALVELAQSGGYVCADHYPHKEVLVGVVEPGTPIELVHGKWGNRNNWAGRAAVLKTLQLTRTSVVEPSAHAVILVGRPRQGTLMKWPRAGKVIENIVEGRTDGCSLSDLSPDQQEIICSEFLRTPDAAAMGLPTLARLLLPVGRTMKDIDIAGLASDGSRIYAQVTFSGGKTSLNKINKLRDYAAGRCHLILFCECEKPTMWGSIHAIPLSLVYDSFCESDLGAAWLRAASGRQ